MIRAALNVAGNIDSPPIPQSPLSTISVSTTIVNATSTTTSGTIPVPIAGDFEQAFIIFIPVSLKISTDVERGVGQHLLTVPDQKNKNASDTTVSVTELVDQFKLSLQDCQLDQSVFFSLCR